MPSDLGGLYREIGNDVSCDWEGCIVRLLESSKVDEYADVMKDIKSKCKSFIKDTKNSYGDTLYFLFSGRAGTRPYFRAPVRKGRDPKDMHPEIHNDFDDQFKRQFGIRGRTECLFATGSTSEASQYGNVFIILPIGKYHILWSPKIKDLFTHIQKECQYDNEYKSLNALKKRFRLKLNKDTIDDEVERAYRKYIEDTVMTYKVSPISSRTVMAIDSYNELMVSCKEYYAIRYLDWTNLAMAYEKKYGDFLNV